GERAAEMPSAPAPAASTAAVAPPAVAADANLPPRGAARFVPARPSPLRDRIRDATDLRALYDRMKDDPDRTGEASYRLAEAIFECSAFVDVAYEDLSRRLAIAKKALDNPRRQEVLAFMFERCKGFSGNSAAMT